ncbi:hypothetical protein FOL47_000483 [Perkinsus chesapeaki]|uniref:Peptidase A1 domain-containing protein n=1 Tax=Perkinsus chesapeaki TaxID=330153 RepID=A0A7J6KVI7_PERCH|nr:hypothetical protein FOL47_000483 [Perkinsus chesapeaki]
MHLRARANKPAKMTGLHFIFFLLCDTVVLADKAGRMDIFLERTGSSSSVLNPLVNLHIDGINVNALVDTGGVYLFFLWKTWYEATQNGSCASTIYKCYECDPAPCLAGPSETLKFDDGSRVRTFLYTSSINFGTESARGINIGLVCGFVPGPESRSTVWASLGLRARWSSMYPDYMTIIEQLLAQPAGERLIDRSSFSVYMKAEEHPSGEVILGGQDPTKYDGLLGYIKVVNDDEQYINLLGIKIGKGNKIEFHESTVLDTGTPKLIFSFYLQSKVLNLLRTAGKKKVGIREESGNFVIPCDEAKFLPAITFYLQGLQGEPVPLEVIALSIVNKVDEDKCLLDIDFSEDPSFVIGLPAYIGNYYFYELEDSRIGLAKTRT